MNEDREFEELDFDDEGTVEAKKVSVFVESTIGPNQRKEKLVVSTDASIAEIKATLSNLFGLPDTRNFHLAISGRICDDDDLLVNYDLEDGDVILVIPISTAG